jgi:hypothetical protein
MVYRGGKLVTSAVRVTDGLPKVFTDVDVAKLLQAYVIDRGHGNRASLCERVDEDWHHAERIFMYVALLHLLYALFHLCAVRAS